MLPVLATALRQFLLFNAVLTPLELLWPGRPEQPLLRRGVCTDLAYFFATPLVQTSAGVALLGCIGVVVASVVPAAWRAGLAAQPWAVTLLEVILLSELGAYAAHRLAHRVPWLWHFHRTHHRTEEMGWLAAHRQHPIDLLWMLAATNLPVVLLGFDTTTIFAGLLAQKFHTALVHGNLGWSFGPVGQLIASPRFHHWHHDGVDARARNFAALFPWLDRLFGTYVVGEGLPRRYGLGHVLAE